MSIAQCIQRSLAVLLLLTMLLQRYRWVLVAGYSRVRTCREQHCLQHRGGYTIRCRSTDKLSSSVRNDLDIFPDIDDAMPVEFKSGFLTTMRDRGFIHQCTDFKTLDHKFSNGIVTAYLGFDATAKSLHVGSLLQIMILRMLQKQGHKPIILIGGGTTKVGDPTGKDESRQLLTEETINSNINSLTQVFSKFITFGDGPTDALMVNNAEWLDSINYLSFLRDYGRYFTINRMLSFESVKQRLAREQPLTFLEFNYMLLQSYDFLELYRRRNAVLQLGGSDQWGNIVSGVELARKVSQVQLFGLTAPLMTTSDGKKMGKTASGAVWLNKDLLSEYDYWQFWRNTADADVIRFLKLFTELPLDVIRDEYGQLQGSELNRVKVILADEATKLLHGEGSLEAIHQTVASLYASGSRSGTDNVESLAKIQLDKNDFVMNVGNRLSIPVYELLLKADMATSKSEARRLIKQGGAKVNDEKVVDELYDVTVDSFDDQGKLKLSSGKKKHVIVLLPSTMT